MLFSEQAVNSRRNSVAFEVLLSPKVQNARKPRLTPLKGKENLNIQLLEEKQLAAEKRRKVIVRYNFLFYKKRPDTNRN